MNLVPPAVAILGIGVLTFGIRPRMVSVVIYTLSGWSHRDRGRHRCCGSLGARHVGVAPDGLGPHGGTALEGERNHDGDRLHGRTPRRTRIQATRPAGRMRTAVRFIVERAPESTTGGGIGNVQRRIPRSCLGPGLRPGAARRARAVAPIGSVGNALTRTQLIHSVSGGWGAPGTMAKLATTSGQGRRTAPAIRFWYEHTFG